MSDTDIYKNRQPMPVTGTKPKRRRRRSSNSEVFDETGNRRRRSKNSGFRRLLHLLRKPKNEKRFWLGLLIGTAVILIFIAIWQFWYMEQLARKQSKQNEMYIPLQEQSQTDSAAE